MSLFRCYTREELRDFILGNTNSEISEAISVHLDQCDICEDTVVGLENTSDNLVKVLSGPKPDARMAYDGNPDFVKALSKAKAAMVADCEPAEHFAATPQRIGDYELVEKIANGGMGSVFRAQHIHLGKEVAIKVLPERKMQNSESIARFTREMKIVGQMDHPAMVAATDAGNENGVHYLVMEMVDGMDLGKLVRVCGALSEADACELVRQAAIGVASAHEKGVIHRDVKPSNLMLTATGKVKVLDLGLATLDAIHGSVDELTTVGQLMGTLDYMAPEQTGGPDRVGFQTDVYGLGATLYKLLAGVAPYTSAEYDSPLKKLKAMALHDAIPLKERKPNISEGIASIVHRCLNRESTDRFESTTALAEELSSYCEEADLLALLKYSTEVQNENRQAACVGGLDIPKVNGQPLPHSATPSKQLKKESPKADARNGLARIGKFLVCVFAMGVLGWAGVILYLNTALGQLVIESEVDDIKVTVLKNETATTSVEVEHGNNSTRLRAGIYQVIIDGKSDELVIDKSEFTLRRGQTVVAKISKRPPVKVDEFQGVTAGLPEGSASNGRVKTENANVDSKPRRFPTENGLDLLEYVMLSIKSTSSSDRKRIEKPIVRLAKYYDSEELDRIAKDVIGGFEFELSSGVHKKVVATLSPLCLDEKVLRTVLDHVCFFSTSRGNSLEGGVFDTMTGYLDKYSKSGMETLMLEKATSAESESKLLAIRWAWLNTEGLKFDLPIPTSRKQNSRRGGGGGGGAMLGGMLGSAAERGSRVATLADEWKKPLLKIASSEERELAKKACFVLTNRFANSAEAMKVYEGIKSGELSRTLLGACFVPFATSNKLDPANAFAIVEQFVVGEITARDLLQVARFDQQKHEGILVKVIAERLTSSDWGLAIENSNQDGRAGAIYGVMSSSGGGGMLGGGGMGAAMGRRPSCKRLELIREIRAQQCKDFLPQLSKQFELPLVFVPREVPSPQDREDEDHEKDAASLKRQIFSSTNDAIAELTNVPSNSLFQGRNVNAWLELLIDSSSSEEMKLPLQGLYELRGMVTEDEAYEFVRLFVPEMRRLSFLDYKGDDLESPEAIAISVFEPMKTNRRNKRTAISYAFKKLLGESKQEDLPYILWATRNWSHFDGNTFRLFLRALQDDNPLIRRRAVARILDQKPSMLKEGNGDVIVSRTLLVDDFDQISKAQILSRLWEFGEYGESDKLDADFMKVFTEPSAIAQLVLVAFGNATPAAQRINQNLYGPLLVRVLETNDASLDQRPVLRSNVLWPDESTSSTTMDLELFELIISRLHPNPEILKVASPESLEKIESNLRERLKTINLLRLRQLEDIIDWIAEYRKKA